MPIPADGQWWYAKIEVSKTHLCRFYLSKDGKEWVEQCEPFQAVAGTWIGAKVGMYAVRECLESTTPYKRTDNDAGYLDVDWFQIEIK